MRAFILMLHLLLAIDIRGVSAQQFSNRGIDYESLGLSDACVAVLNTTVSCNSNLATLASPDSTADLLEADELQVLCVESCRSDLVSVRSRILTTCDPTKDVMVSDNIAYPATYMADKFLYAYDVSCYTDKTTGRFCDLILAEARNSTTSVDCSDCMLGVFALQLSSSIGYSEDFAADFSSVTASCGAVGYQYTTPGPYGSTTSASIPTGTGAPATPSCSRPYTVAAGDTCKSISQANGVSTYGLISRNSLDLSCSRMPSQLCLPDVCQTYMWSELDSCAKITQQYNVSMTQFLAWNPIFDPYCTNAGPSWANWTMCVSPPGGTAPTPPKPSAVPVPENAKDDSEKNCAQWHTVLEGESCYIIIPAGSSITFDQFRVINPSVDADCTTLWLGYAYCILPVDPVTVSASTTFTRPSVTSIPPTVTVPPITATTTLPHAPGSPPSCIAWVNYDDTTLAGEGVATDVGSMAGVEGVDFNNCAYVAYANEIRLVQFILWNPSLKGGDDCTLSPGLSYCIGVGSGGPSVPTTSAGTAPGGGSTTLPTATTTTSASTTSGGATPPAPTQPGTIAPCKKYHTVVSGDGCWAISQQYEISLNDFYKWNPGVGGDCSALWLGYAVCVGI